MQLTPTAIPDVKRIVPRRHGDGRGFFAETFRAEWFPGLTFVQDNHSRSETTGTVRGLHYQIPPHAQAKLVSVVAGAIRDVAVDLRVGSPTFGEHVAETLTAEGGEQLMVPVGFAHGFVTLAPSTEVVYKVTSYYAPEHDRGIAFDDPELAIDWGIATDRAVASDRDRGHPRLSDVVSPFRYGT